MRNVSLRTDTICFSKGMGSSGSIFDPRLLPRPGRDERSAREGEKAARTQRHGGGATTTRPAIHLRYLAAAASPARRNGGCSFLISQVLSCRAGRRSCV